MQAVFSGHRFGNVWNTDHYDLYPGSCSKQTDDNGIPVSFQLQWLLSGVEHGQKYTGHQDKQRLGDRRHEQPPLLSMCVVGKPKTQSGEDETKEEKASEGNCSEPELTSSWMQTGQDDG